MESVHLLPDVLAVLADGSRRLPPSAPVRAVVETLDFLSAQGLVRTSPSSPGVELTQQGLTLHRCMQRCQGTARSRVWYWDGEDFEAGAEPAVRRGNA